MGANLLAAERLGDNAIVWVIPALAALALVVWLALTIEASSRKIHPNRRNDQDNHRGGNQGAYYVYEQGIYSHSYAPGETKYEDRASEGVYKDTPP